MERAPGRHALPVEQADQLLPDERCRFDVIGAPTERTNRATEVSSERAQAAPRQIGQKAPGDIPRTDQVERKQAGGQRAKERLLESSEVNDGRRGLRETRGLVGHLAPDAAPVDRGPHHVFGDPGNPRNSRRNPLAIRQRDQRRMGMRRCRAEDAGQANLQELTSRSGGCGLAVDHQHLELRERLGRTG
jgi:hypothetical protein